MSVDDDEDLLPIYKKLFPLIFKEVFFANNGKEGLEIFKKEDIDLVVTDILMPEMGGEEMIKEILKIREVPIICLTAFENIDIEKCFFLKKPITTENLINTLREALPK